MKTNYRIENGCLYLNNSGSRWIIIENGEKIKVSVLFPDGHIEKRTCLYFESFGNFAVTCISLKGKKQTFFQDEIFIQDNDDNEIIFRGIVLK
jgi:hypothetical protein